MRKRISLSIVGKRALDTDLLPFFGIWTKINFDPVIVFTATFGKREFFLNL